MSVPGLTSPIRTETFRNLQLNAGIFLANFNHSAIATADAMRTAIAAEINSGTNTLGATRGGGSFTATRELRTPEVDGMRYPFKGADFVDSVDAYLSGTLLEATPENFKRLFATAEVTTEGKKTTIRIRTAIDAETDYLPKLCWVGDLADGRFVMIELDNAINTADFSLTFTDKGEGVMPFEFHARQSNVTDYDYAPFDIIFLDKAA